MTKKASKKSPKKAPKKSTKASVDHLAQSREKHKRERAHVDGKLKVAHRAVLSIVDVVKAEDRAGIDKLRRAVEHAHDNAHAGRN